MVKEKVYVYGKVDYELEGVERDNQLIEDEYKKRLKFGKDKMPKELVEKYEQLNNRTKLVRDIKKIIFIKDAYLGRRYFSKQFNSFVVVEDKAGICLMYNVTTGEDHSFDFNREIHIIEDVSEIVTLYDYNSNDFQSKMDIGYMNSICLYEDIILKNVYTGISYDKSSYIEFRDKQENVFYVDILLNKLYFRNNCYDLVDKESYEPIVLFEDRRSTEINMWVLNNK